MLADDAVPAVYDRQIIICRVTGELVGTYSCRRSRAESELGPMVAAINGSIM
jgi:hypothetical protein